MSLIVELEQGVWLADGDGDPPRTLVRENARQFASVSLATRALRDVRRIRHFPLARILDKAWREQSDGED